MSAPPQVVLAAREAMATRFEMVLHGSDAVALRAAADEALEEIERLEAQLSPFRPTSDIAQINAQAAHGPVRVEPSLFRLLEHARRLHAETAGAFDLTVGPLMRRWGFRAEAPVPGPEATRQALEAVGMHHVLLDAQNSTVRFDRPGVALDLGALGKGYAIDRAARCLREAGVTNALIHGGTSTVLGLGHPLTGAETWKVAVDYPPRNAPPLPPPHHQGLYAVVALQDMALSVSTNWGRVVTHGNATLGHVMDPRTGQPATAATLAAVVTASAADSDALSTALLALGPAGHGQMARGRPDLRTLVVHPEAEGKVAWTGHGLELRPR